MGFILDSQTFGSRRDTPDIVARAGDYGYMEYGAKLGSNKQIDLKYKYGGNGRTIEGTSEFSYLYDLGVYGAQREAYYTPDGEDVSLAALGFLEWGGEKTMIITGFSQRILYHFKQEVLFQ